MYSYEDRPRAVRLYKKLDKRARATILQWGYPTNNSFKSWHRELEQGRDFPVGYVRSRSKYSDKQKKVAVEYYLNNERCIAETRRALGYLYRDTLGALVDELHSDMRKHVVGKAGKVLRPSELKHAAVIELCTKQVSPQAIAYKLAVSRSL